MYIKSCPRDGKTHIFRSDVHAKILRFFDQIFMIRVAMGAVNLKIVPEASVFRGDAYYDGPGAQKYHFWRKRPFWKIFFRKIFSKNSFRDIFFQKKNGKTTFPGKRGWGLPFRQGVRPEKLLPLFTPWFLKTVLVTKRVAVGATEIIPNDFCVIFQADAEFDVKSDVASYFWAVFEHFLGQKFGQNFCFFLGVR